MSEAHVNSTFGQTRSNAAFVLVHPSWAPIWHRFFDLRVCTQYPITHDAADKGTALNPKTFTLGISLRRDGRQTRLGFSDLPQPQLRMRSGSEQMAARDSVRVEFESVAAAGWTIVRWFKSGARNHLPANRPLEFSFEIMI